MKPQFHPISKMPLLEEGINGIVESSEEQLSSLNKAKDKPYIFDDAIVVRILKVFSEQKEYLKLYEKQFNLWQKGKTSVQQSNKLKELQLKLNKAKSLNAEILKLAKQFKNKTIEKVMEKNDLELALDFLTDYDIK
jgi:hypothetical protein